MISLIKSIEGPVFVFVYAGFCICVIVGLKLMARMDHSRKMQIPEPTKLSPIAISMLKNGVKATVAISLFNLWRNKAISIATNKKVVVVKQKDADISKFNEIEQQLYKDVRRPIDYKTLFKNAKIKSYDDLSKPYIEELKKLELIPNDTTRVYHRKLYFIGIFLILGLGGLKLFLGYANNKPGEFLIIEMVIAFIVAQSQLKFHGLKQTNLGRRFIRHTEERFKWVKDSVRTDKNYFDESVMYTVALFGIATVLDPQVGRLIDKPFVSDQIFDSGSGCSSCSGGCSGGCGGGCGGCGGD